MGEGAVVGGEWKGECSLARGADVGVVDVVLWDALRGCRPRLAAGHNVPPYVVFHGCTLRPVANERPNDSEALLEISGVGQAKLTRYGDEFLEVIRRTAV